MQNQFTFPTLTKNPSDNFVIELQEDKAQAILVVELQNGELVFGDDGRPGQEPSSFWKRLKMSEPEIHNIYIQFRTEKVQPFPANQKAYFFCKGLIKAWNSNEKPIYFFKLGCLINDNEFLVKNYQVPELILVEEEKRIVEESSENIIWNKNF